MKKILFISLFISLSNCKTETKTGYYHGYILNKMNKPIANVRVNEYNRVPLMTITDSTGYFKLYHSPISISNLIFKKEGYQVDTIQTRWNRYSGSGQRFLNKAPDTLILRKVKKEKVKNEK